MVSLISANQPPLIEGWDNSDIFHYRSYTIQLLEIDENFCLSPQGGLPRWCHVGGDAHLRCLTSTVLAVPKFQSGFWNRGTSANGTCLLFVVYLESLKLKREERCLSVALFSGLLLRFAVKQWGVVNGTLIREKGDTSLFHSLESCFFLTLGRRSTIEYQRMRNYYIFFQSSHFIWEFISLNDKLLQWVTVSHSLYAPVSAHRKSSST